MLLSDLANQQRREHLSTDRPVVAAAPCSECFVLLWGLFPHGPPPVGGALPSSRGKFQVVMAWRSISAVVGTPNAGHTACLVIGVTVSMPAVSGQMLMPPMRRVCPLASISSTKPFVS